MFPLESEAVAPELHRERRKEEQLRFVFSHQFPEPLSSVYEVSCRDGAVLRLTGL
jgi:hypothetical protein